MRLCPDCLTRPSIRACCRGVVGIPRSAGILRFFVKAARPLPPDQSSTPDSCSTVWLYHRAKTSHRRWPGKMRRRARKELYRPHAVYDRTPRPAPGWWHWVVYNIMRSVLPENASNASSRALPPGSLTRGGGFWLSLLLMATLSTGRRSAASLCLYAACSCFENAAHLDLPADASPRR